MRPPDTKTDINSTKQFVSWLRSVAPYINLFKERVFVIAVPGLMIKENKIQPLIHDLALLHSMGMKIVLVFGIKPQLEELINIHVKENTLVNGIRISNDKVMECVKRISSQIRLNIEASLSCDLPNTPMRNSRIKVVSGNFITAKPYGIHGGIDYQSTGVVRKIEKHQILRSLNDNSIVLLSPLGFSPTGEIFNLSFEDVASFVAGEISADKLIFFVDFSSIPSQINEKQGEISCKKMKEIIIEQNDVNKTNQVFIHSVKACELGVKRTHLIPYENDGAILTELFTHKGLGLMVVEEKLEFLRVANIEDISSILSLIEPLEKKGILKYRDRNSVENEIENFTVIEHDGIISGCVFFKPNLDDLSGELGCLIVHQDFQFKGEGEKLLLNTEKKARSLGLESIFVKTTVASHWFIKRGFNLTEDMEVNSTFNNNRQSKFLIKRVI